MFAFLNTFICVTLFLTANALKLCGLEDLETCDPNDTACVTHLESEIRKWLLGGRPDYFLEPIEPLKLQQLTFAVKEEQFNMDNVTISGLGDSDFIDWLFDMKKKQLKYAYKHSLNVGADRLTKKDSKNNVLGKTESFHIQLVNLIAHVSVDIDFVSRCDGQLYLKIESREILVDDLKDEVTLAESDIIETNREDFVSSATKTIGKSATEAIAGAFRQINTIIPLTVLFKI